MNTKIGAPHDISVDFLTDEGAVPIPVLNSVLAALQQAVYAVGAYDTGKDQLRGETRYRYTLSVGAIRYGSLHVDLIPAAMHTIEQLGLFTSIAENIAASALYDAAKFALNRLRDHFNGKPPDSTISQEEPKQAPDVIRDQALWQSACNSAKAIARSGIPVRIAMTTQGETDIELVANTNQAARVLQQDAIWRGRAQRYTKCELIGVDIVGPNLRAKIPYYRDSIIRCAFDSSNPALIANSLHYGGEKYTIVGTPIWNPGRYYQDKPSKIEIITVEDSEGDIILTSIQEYETEQGRVIDGGLFFSGEADAS